MIEASITKLLMRKCPNWHLVSRRFAKDSLSICTCAKCRFSVLGTDVYRRKPERTCKPLLDRLIDDGLPIGYARVDANGTCDAAQFVQEDESDFRLESETAVIRMCKDNATEKPEFRVEGGQGGTV